MGNRPTTARNSTGSSSDTAFFVVIAAICTAIAIGAVYWATFLPDWSRGALLLFFGFWSSIFWTVSFNLNPPRSRQLILKEWRRTAGSRYRPICRRGVRVALGRAWDGG